MSEASDEELFVNGNDDQGPGEGDGGAPPENLGGADNDLEESLSGKYKSRS